MGNTKRRWVTGIAMVCLLLLLYSPVPLAAEAGDNIRVDFAEENTAQEEQAAEAEDAEEDQHTQSQQQIDALSKQLEELENQRKEIQREINSTKSDREREEASKIAIEEQIGITQNEIGLLLQRLTLLESEMANKEADIQRLQQEILQKQQEHDAHYQDYLVRLRGMQLRDEGSVLGVLLGVDSYTDFLSGSEQLSCVAEYDRGLMQRVQVERQELERATQRLVEESAALKESAREVENQRRTVEEKKQTLATQQQQVEQRIQDIHRMEREHLADLEQNQAVQKQMQAELDQIYEQIKWSDTPYVGGAMLWPVKGYYDISSYFGLRFGGTDFHKGNDIYGPGIHGQPVLAANDGTVSYTNWTHVKGRGYGMYVMIDHGGGTSTLYAHLSNIQVSTGQQVKRGQVIGNVGSTGWSTGPHLHFEVRENKVAVDSLPYIRPNT